MEQLCGDDGCVVCVVAAEEGLVHSQSEDELALGVTSLSGECWDNEFNVRSSNRVQA